MPTATVPMSTIFCADDADVVIRAAGALDFHVHKLILSLASPIFKDVFAIPQPPTDTPGISPHVDVQDPPETWETLLRVIYRMPNQTTDKLDDLESLLLVAEKYQMQSVIDAHKKVLEYREFVQEDPLRLYAIACRWGFGDQAKFVARNAELLTVTKRPNAGDLAGLTVSCYHSLVSFLAERDNEWHQTMDKVGVDASFSCNCRREDLYGKIKENLKRPYLRAEEIYLIALEDRSKYFPSSCNYALKNCSLAHWGMKSYVERMIKARESVCDKFIIKYNVGTLNGTRMLYLPHCISLSRFVSPQGRRGREGAWVHDPLASRTSSRTFMYGPGQNPNKNT